MEIPSEVRAELEVVDNDAQPSAEPVVADARASFAYNVRYVHEPARGISAARNRAVAESAPSDFVAFVDDDEWVERDWLTQLVGTQQDTGADVVTGPVLAVFDEPPPAWVRDGEFFARPRFPHQSPLGWAATGSVLISRRALEAVPGPFDPAFGLSGGEDTLFFDILRSKGHEIVWCDRAIAHEAIPPSRVSWKWIQSREYRRGQTLGRVLRARGVAPWLLLRRGVKGLLEIALGAVRLPYGALRNGKAGALRGLHQMTFGVGILSGLVGGRYEEYDQ